LSLRPRRSEACGPLEAREGAAAVAKQVVGLKIGASRLAAARLSLNGSAELVQVASDPLPGGIVSVGEVREPAALSAALKEFFGRHKLPKRNVRVGIANNRIGVRTIEVS